MGQKTADDTTDNLKPGLLVASPQMEDPFFASTVVLLCRHEEDGAMGVVINRSTDLEMDQVVADLGIELPPETNHSVMWGGPVEPTRGTIVFRAGRFTSDDSLHVHGDVHVSGSQEVLRQLASDPALGDDWFLSLGYAGWGPGQLDREIHEGSWIVLSVDPSTVFEAPIDDRYDLCIASLGIDASMIFMNPINE